MFIVGQPTGGVLWCDWVAGQRRCCHNRLLLHGRAVFDDVAMHLGHGQSHDVVSGFRSLSSVCYPTDVHLFASPGILDFMPRRSRSLPSMVETMRGVVTKFHGALWGDEVVNTM